MLLQGAHPAAYHMHFGGWTMFRIGICEDEAAQRRFLKNCIERWADARKHRVQLSEFADAEQFLFEYEDNAEYDLLILDIQMGEMNGMELAKQVRKSDKEVKIVFLTGIKDHAIEGYEVGAVRYLLKPLKQDVLDELLDTIYSETKRKQEDCFLFVQNGATVRMPYSRILYAEANGHYLGLMTERKRFEWKANFSSVSQEFEAQGFFLLKRGLLVNLEHVERITKTDCVMDNGELLPVARNRYRELNEAFIAYYRGENE